MHDGDDQRDVVVAAKLRWTYQFYAKLRVGIHSVTTTGADSPYPGSEAGNKEGTI